MLCHMYIHGRQFSLRTALTEQQDPKVVRLIFPPSSHDTNTVPRPPPPLRQLTSRGGAQVYMRYTHDTHGWVTDMSPRLQIQVRLSRLYLCVIADANHPAAAAATATAAVCHRKTTADINSDRYAHPVCPTTTRTPVPKTVG